MWTYFPELLARPVPRYTSYPTAAEFSASAGPLDQGEALARVGPEDDVSLYVHIPFCEEICWYCGCNTARANKASRLAAYLEALNAEIATVAARLEGRGKVRRLAFGGGSPNALSTDEFASLCDTLRRAFAIDAAMLSIELDPRNFTCQWARELGRQRVGRASLGVQTFDPAIQAAIGRIQPRDLIVETVSMLRGNGVGSINFDLMYGLPGQDYRSLSATLDETIALAPERIALFGYAHVPHILPRQRRIATDNLPGQAERFALAQLGYETLTSAGYVPIGFDHFARPGDALAEAQVEGRLHRNFQGFTEDDASVMIGLGATAISRFPGLLVQNEKNSGRYRMRSLSGLLAGERGILRNPEDERRGLIIEDLLCGRPADIAPFLGDVGLRQALSPFLDRALAMLDGTTLALSPDGRPYSRVIAALFDRYRGGEGQRFSTAV